MKCFNSSLYFLLFKVMGRILRKNTSETPIFLSYVDSYSSLINELELIFLHNWRPPNLSELTQRNFQSRGFQSKVC